MSEVCRPALIWPGDGRQTPGGRAEALRALAHFPAFELKDALNWLAVLPLDARQSTISIGREPFQGQLHPRCQIGVDGAPPRPGDGNTTSVGEAPATDRV